VPSQPLVESLLPTRPHPSPKVTDSGDAAPSGPPISQRGSGPGRFSDRASSDADTDWGNRDTILSRDTVVSDLPPVEIDRNRALLLRMDGADAGQVVSLSDVSVLVGRHPSTELTIDDRGLSRLHARLYRQADGYFVEDLGSSNGTFVQGERVNQRALHDGDVVQFGPRVTFRYTLADRRQEQLLRQMYQSSTRDALTGVHNRQHFTERLAAEVAYAARHHGSVAVVMFDIDHFKRVNDTYGHPTGDGVLRHVAQTIARRLRTEDLFARYGGEEFIVLLRGGDIVAASRLAERVRVAVAAQPALLESHQIAVTISAGCAALGCAPGHQPEQLIAVADRRLYAAKRAGRNRVVYTD
jgi:two-component system cell cycle response regulator